MRRTHCFQSLTRCTVAAAALALRVGAAAGPEALPTIRILNPEEQPIPLAATIPAKSADLPKNPFPERPPWVADRGDGMLRCYIGTGFSASFDVRSGASILRDADALLSGTARTASISVLDEMNLPTNEAKGGFMVHDQGPILWPQTGYIDADAAQASHGARHAYGLIDLMQNPPQLL